MRKSFAQLLVLSLILCGCQLTTNRNLNDPQTTSPEGGDPTGGNPRGGTPLLSSIPVGYFDVIDNSGVAAGWSLTPSRAPGAIQVAFYVDGPKGTGSWVGTTEASLSRGDVNTAT